MSRNLAPGARRARRKTRLLGRLVLAAVAGGVVAAWLAVETRPRVDAGPPDAAAARAALAAGETLRAFVEEGAGAGRLALGEGEINALLASAGRLAPGLRGAARVEGDGVTLTLSAGAPHLPEGLWANVTLGVAAGPGLRIDEVRIGRLPLPAVATEAGLRLALDRALGGDGLGRALLAGVEAVGVEGETAHADLAFAPEAQDALVEGLREALNLSAGASEVEPVRRQLYWLSRTGAEGGLPGSGSVLPYLGHVMERAALLSRRLPELSDREHAAAGLLALAIHCGETALGAAIGVDLTERMRGEAERCAGTTLGGRDDLKRHFLVSAGLYAASTGAATAGIGELKELLDSAEGGSGFSFDDMAANRAGARFAAAWLAAPKADWPALAARIGTEADVLPPLADLPRGLSEAEFRARFETVDSPAYAGLIAKIDRRIDALPFHRTPGG